jgi:hypothetical protein
MIVMSCTYLVQEVALLCRIMTSTPENLRVMYSEASVLSTLYSSECPFKIKVHGCLFNKEMPFTTLGEVFQFLDIIDCLAALIHAIRLRI